MSASNAECAATKLSIGNAVISMPFSSASRTSRPTALGFAEGHALAPGSRESVAIIELVTAARRTQSKVSVAIETGDSRQ
jgi:hypothetical protein